MLNNVTSHTTLHYQSNGAAIDKKSRGESLLPILMIIVGIAGICLLMYGS